MKKLLFSFAALAAVIACDQTNELKPATEREVSIVAQASETKTTLDGDAVVWEDNDVIDVVFFKTEGEYQVFSIDPFETNQGGSTAVFNGTLSESVNSTACKDEGLAIYPSGVCKLDSPYSFELPSAIQMRKDGSFDSGLNVSSAKVLLSDLIEKGTTTAEFKNIFSVIRFTLDAGVKSLKLTAENALVGSTYMGYNNSTGLLEKSTLNISSSNSITITPPTYGFDGTTAYNVLVFPGTHNWIEAELTDEDGCTYSNRIEREFKFESSKYYKFNFNTKFERTYSFTASGRNFVAGDKIQTVFADMPSEELTAADGGVFTGNTTHEAYKADAAGYAIYPATAYNNGNITCELPADGTVYYSDLWVAPITLKSTTAAFTSVKDALAQLSFTVPAGVKSVKVTSDKGIVGTAPISADGGVFVSGEGNKSEIVIASAEEAYELYAYPVGITTLTFTLTDAAGSTVTKPHSVELSANGRLNINLGEVSFDKNGNFTHEGFVSGGEAIQF